MHGDVPTLDQASPCGGGVERVRDEDVVVLSVRGSRYLGVSADRRSTCQVGDGTYRRGDRDGGGRDGCGESERCLDLGVSEKRDWCDPSALTTS